jgi:hypothetical protein
MSKIGIFLLSAAVSGSAMAAAQPQSSDEIYSSLTRQLDRWQGRQLVDDPIADLKMNRAVAWLDGVYSATQLFSVDPGTRLKVCLPESLQTQVAVRLYVNYMDTHPDSHSSPPVVIAIASAGLAFPCPKK